MRAYPSWDHFFADQRFVEHSLAELRQVAGVRRVEAVIPSHYHDDHLAGVPWLQRTEGAQAWIFEAFAEMVARPHEWKVPCLLGEPIAADRVLVDGERVRWRDWSFDVFHMPGHTWWALGLSGEVDGRRVALTGDNLLAGALSPLRAAAPIYRNRMRLDSIATGVRLPPRRGHAPPPPTDIAPVPSPARPFGVPESRGSRGSRRGGDVGIWSAGPRRCGAWSRHGRGRGDLRAFRTYRTGWPRPRTWPLAPGGLAVETSHSAPRQRGSASVAMLPTVPATLATEPRRDRMARLVR